MVVGRKKGGKKVGKGGKESGKVGKSLFNFIPTFLTKRTVSPKMSHFVPWRFLT
jgi:hypothetical protein